MLKSTHPGAKSLLKMSSHTTADDTFSPFISFSVKHNNIIVVLVAFGSGNIYTMARNRIYLLLHMYESEQ